MRPSTLFIKNNLKENLVGVEIGVYQGTNAKDILQNLSIKKLYLIDPYIHYSEYKCSLNPDFGKNFEIAKQRLASFTDKIIWIKKKSFDSIDDVPNDLDFVYIDGNHSYKYVKQDLENYWIKIKKGGVIAGHDYNRPAIEEKFGVTQAINEWVLKNDVRLQVKAWDWWCLKQ